MGPKRNEYLDISDEDEELGSESDEQEQGRAARIRGNAAKKRKLSEIASALLDGEELEVESDHEEETKFEYGASQKASLSKREESAQASSKSATGLKLSDSYQEKKRKTGVVYLSRIPPFMKPSALRHLLSPYGTLLRIFLTPEPSPAYLKRVKAGGNKKRSFVDGWVEFASKKKAKICAETLNGNIIGGKKGGWYHDDIWNIKYLKGFKWDDLMEQVQDEERVRQGRLRAEIKQEAKERRAFLESVEQDKMEKTREAKRRKRLLASEVPEDATEREHKGPAWTQNKVKQRDKETVIEPQDDVKRVLSKIF